MTLRRAMSLAGYAAFSVGSGSGRSRRIAGGAGGRFGFVDVWDGGRRLGRRDIVAGEVRQDDRVIAEIEFVLPEATNHLDYRIWVDGRTPIVLERVELFSIGP